MSWAALDEARRSRFSPGCKLVLIELAYQKRDARDDFYVTWDEFDTAIGIHHHHIRKHIAALVDARWIEVVEDDSSGAYVPDAALVFRWLGDPSERAKRAPTLFDEMSECTEPRGKRAEPRDAPCIPGHSMTTTSAPTNGADANRASAKRATDDPITKQAHTLAVLAYEQDPKPMCAGEFPAVMKIVEKAIRSGREIGAIRRAILAGVDVWTTAGLARAIAEQEPRNGKRRGSAVLKDAIYEEAGRAPR